MKHVAAAIAVLFAATMIGCGGNSGTSGAVAISISPTSATVSLGRTQQFTANAVDASGNTVSGVTFTWHNSSAGVAIVGTNGLATGIAPGMTVINASVGVVSSPAATLTVTAP